MKTKIRILTFTVLSFLFAVNVTIAQSTTNANAYNANYFLGWGATSGDLWFKVNNATQMTLKNTTGYLGLGTTSPACKFHVAGTDYSTSRTILERSSSLGWGPLLELDAKSSDGNYIQSGRSLGSLSFYGEYSADVVGLGAQINAYTTQDFSSGYGSKLQFYTTPNNSTTNQVRMIIDNTGYVGILTTTPGSALDVKGTFRLSGSTSGYVGFAPAAAAGSTTYTLPSADGSSGQVLQTNGSGTLSWLTTSTPSTGWQLTGNTVGATGNFLGTIDNYDVVIKRNNVQAGLLSTSNTFWGVSAGNAANASGINNIFVGNNAGTNNTYAKDNVAIGVDALKTQSYTNGNTAYSTCNVAVGNGALYSNNPTSTNGFWNVAVGYQAGYKNETGFGNTFMGHYSGYNNLTASENVFLGEYSGYYNTTGYINTFLGSYTGYYNTTAYGNTFVGNNAGYSQNGSNCNYNTCLGYHTGTNTSTGYQNAYVGADAGSANTTGYNNTTLGYHAGGSNSQNISCTFIGSSADADGNYTDATAIGYNATTTANDKIVIGTLSNSGITGGYGNWQNNSDGRFKENIIEDVPGLSFITKLRPVTFTLKAQLLDEFLGIKQRMDTINDVTAQNRYYQRLNEVSLIRQTGFIAQEVDSLAHVIGYNFDGVHIPSDTSTDNYTIGYSTFVVPLVKAVQEQSKTIDSLKIHLKTTDSLLVALQNCCLLGTTSKTIQNNGSQQQDNSENTLQIELANNSQPILYQNEPNPFGDNTVIRYFIPENIKGNAYIVFYDMYGKEIKRTELNTKGFSNINANTEKLASGIYSYSLIVNAQVIDTKKMLKQ